MSEVLLTEFEAALRQAHQQVQYLQRLYRERAEENPNACRRLDELRRYEAALADELSARRLLPTEPNPEEEGFRKLVAGVAGVFSEGPDTLIAMHERELGDLGERLEHSAEPTGHAIAEGIAASRRALSEHT